MKTKTNYWKISAITLILLIVVLSFNLYSNQYYDIGGMKIKKSTVNDFSNSMNDKPFRLCDTSIEDKCLMFARIK